MKVSHSKKRTTDFKNAFDQGFSKPKLLTKKGFDTWADLELLSDTLAGPMYNVLINENINYVFKDVDNRFPGVDDSISFQKWAMNLVNEYKDAVLRFEPKNDDENHDKELLLLKCEGMKNIVYYI